ncbi:MAG: hypothetical protein Q6K99_02135 [Thermostichales cyanobacterium BF4_bins_65]
MVVAVVLALPVAGSANPSVKIGELGRFRGVRIQGTVQAVVGNEFILSDGTGQVIVDAGPRWYHQLNIRPGEQLTVIGEYDDDDFDAFQIIRANGEVMTIRSPGGPPPWAGGRRRWQQSWR